MSNFAVSLTEVSKWFPHRRRDRLRLALPGGEQAAPPPDSVLALDRVDLHVPEGQSVGVIGHNGGGKTTLLRLVAGITEASRGSVRVSGRVASMIELGIGFHPEFTGAENLHYAATLLGMSKARLASLWDDIVEFSGVEYALDQQVREYSSGMLARLGYSLVVHTDAEIILVDEVLAVGDLDFQVRGLERILDLHKQGRTTILVTHQISALPSLCDRIVRLHDGRVVADGKPQEVIPEYVSEEELRLAERRQVPLVVHDVELTPSTVEPLGSLTVRGIVDVHEPTSSMRLGLRIAFGTAWLAAGFPDREAPPIVNMPLDLDVRHGPGRWRVEVNVASLPLAPGRFQAGLVVFDDTEKEVQRSLVPLTVTGDTDATEPLRLALEENHVRID